MNSGICAVLAYCFVILAVNSVVGLRGIFVAFLFLIINSVVSLRDILVAFLLLIISSIVGLLDRDVTAICSFRTGSAGGLGSLSLQHLKDLILQSRSAGGFDRLSPQELKDLHSWISSPGVFDSLSSQQLREVICSDVAPGNLQLQITKTPFKFGYKEFDFLQMDINFKLASDVTGGIVSLRYSLTDHHPKRTFIIRRPHDETDDPVVHIRDIISGERVYVDVQLFNITGVCLNKIISEGRLVKKSLNSSETDYTYNRICLNGNRCQLGVDLRKTSEDAKKLNKPTCTYIYFIILTIFAIVFCVLGIVAFIKLCWMKRDALEILQVPLQPRNPFYVNLLFRKECQEIIDDLEQNHYELID